MQRSTCRINVIIIIIINGLFVHVLFKSCFFRALGSGRSLRYVFSLLQIEIPAIKVHRSERCCRGIYNGICFNWHSFHCCARLTLTQDKFITKVLGRHAISSLSKKIVAYFGIDILIGLSNNKKKRQRANVYIMWIKL